MEKWGVLLATAGDISWWGLMDAPLLQRIGVLGGALLSKFCIAC